MCILYFYSYSTSSAVLFFFFNDTATTEIYTLSLHDALPIWATRGPQTGGSCTTGPPRDPMDNRGASASAGFGGTQRDRKSTRLNSSHLVISYAVFCLKKKKKNYTTDASDM